MEVAESWSVTGAARQAGVEPETLRQAVKRGHCRSARDAEGKPRVRLVDVIRWRDDADLRKTGPKPAKSG